MNDREMLEWLEYCNADPDGVAVCPVCNHYEDEGHLPRCELGKHLHPEAVVGSWQWAKAQGEAGKKVRRKSWLNRRFFLKRRAWGWDGYDGHDVPCGNSRYEDGPTDGDDWELYAPAPAPEPKTVVWALVDANWGLELREHGRYGATCLMQGKRVEGYRLDTFLGHLSDGCEAEMGTLLMGYATRLDSQVCVYPTPNPTTDAKVWADSVRMVKVQEAK